MKIAYLASQYPAVSHTFILREVQALRAQGVDVGTFSIHKAKSGDILGPRAVAEAKSTRWIVPTGVGVLIRAAFWALRTRPKQTLRTAMRAVGKAKATFRERILQACYLVEAMILARWLHAEKFDHLHCHFGNSGSNTAMLAAELAGVPFSITCHGSELLAIRQNRLVEKVDRASFIACVSKYGKAQLMMNCPALDWRKLHLVRCGYSVNGQVRSTDGSASKHILCVGRLSREKGQFVLLDALAVLRDQGLEFRCTLVGDGPLRREIESRVRDLGLTSHVHLTGAMPSEKVMEQYMAADIVVLASFSEGVPVVLMEAMAVGCPVVATNVGGVSEVVLNGKTGVLVAPGDSEELADAIRWAFENPDQAETLGLNGREHVRKEFCPETATQRLMNLFECSIGATLPPSVRSKEMQ